METGPRRAPPVPSLELEALLRRAYGAFNARDLDGALALMDPHVAWPNAMEGGTVHGREGVRAYWTRQWTLIDPQVDPVRFVREDDGRIAVLVHQVVRDRAGGIRSDRILWHVHRVRAGLIVEMEIRSARGPG